MSAISQHKLFMLKQLTISLLGFSLVFSGLPGNAQSAPDENQQCEAALDTAKQQLLSNRHLWITNTRIHQAGDVYYDFPSDSPMILQIEMGGNDASNVMNSPQLLTAITQTITNGCSAVGLVSYGVNATDWSINFGRIGNQIRQFECVDPGDSRGRQWGHVTCL
jgi:hypothetical protein